MKIFGLHSNLLIIFILVSNFILFTNCTKFDHSIKNNEEKSFVIKDSTFQYNKENPISNLDRKRGFKNIFIGNKLQDFYFGEEWETYEITDDYVFLAETSKVEGDINKKNIKLIRLFFFKDTLVNIQVYMEEGEDPSILLVLEYLYGKPNFKDLRMVKEKKDSDFFLYNDKVKLFDDLKTNEIHEIFQNNYEISHDIAARRFLWHNGRNTIFKNYYKAEWRGNSIILDYLKEEHNYEDIKIKVGTSPIIEKSGYEQTEIIYISDINYNNIINKILQNTKMKNLEKRKHSLEEEVEKM